MTTTVFEIRRENLRRVIRDRCEGNRAAFSRAAGVHQNQVNLILSENMDHQRNLGEALARRMEAGLGLAPGYLDQPSAVTPSGRVVTVQAGEVPEGLGSILIRDDMQASTALYTGYLEQFAGRMSAKENLQFFRIGTKDMTPELVYGDYVLVDVGVKAVTSDGVYILGNGADLFLRRVQKLVTGGWVISTPGGDPIKVDDLQGIKAMARIVLVSRHVVL